MQSLPQFWSQAPSPPMTVTAPTVIRNTPTDLCEIFVQAPGTSGNLVMNDAASLSAANPGNQILSQPASALTRGEMLVATYACVNGLVVSSVPSGAVVTVYWIQPDQPFPPGYPNVGIPFVA